MLMHSVCCCFTHVALGSDISLLRLFTTTFPTALISRIQIRWFHLQRVVMTDLVVRRRLGPVKLSPRDLRSINRHCGPVLANRPVGPSPAVSASQGTQDKEESGKALSIGDLLISIRAASTKTLPEGAFPNEKLSGSDSFR